ncbi:UNVERIFIED_CONTAM: hypothetical protein FKN15_007830 [Acipenser sinensis]
MIAEDSEEEEVKDSVIRQLTSIQNLDLDSLKDKAQAIIEELKQTAEKCSVIVTMQPPRATASEDNAALGSIQASPQAPHQTTEVTGVW